MSNPNPLVSVITICLNAEQTIRVVIDSVLGQSYKNIEYIIVDGGSTDATVNIAKEYGSQIAKIISEPDNGISDAFNKGINAAKGEFIQIINADDYLDASKIEKSVALLVDNENYGFVFGDIKFRDQGKLKTIPGDRYYYRSIRYVMSRINHPTVMSRSSLYNQFGNYDIRWKIAMDYDWHLRIHNRGIKGLYSSELIAYTSAGGVSDRERFKAFEECRRISISHGLNPIYAYGYYFLRCIKHVLFLLLKIR